MPLASLGFAPGWLSFLGVFVIARVGYSASLVFYDSMLPEITSEEQMDKISSLGYAFGYIGSVIPFILCLLLVLFGGKRIPELARALGKAQYEYKKAKEMLQNEAQELKDTVEKAAAEEEKKDK